MLRAFFASACVALAVVLVAGCGGQGSGGKGPSLANPNDPKVKDLKLQIPAGGGKSPAPQ